MCNNFHHMCEKLNILHSMTFSLSFSPSVWLDGKRCRAPQRTSCRAARATVSCVPLQLLMSLRDYFFPNEFPACTLNFSYF